MDNFRWILLGVGILIIVIIYLISRKNRRDFYQDEDYTSEDLPDIKTTSWDDLDEGVGEVRIVARNNDYEPPSLAGGAAQAELLDDEDQNDPLFAKWPKTGPAPEPEQTPESGTEPEPAPEPTASAAAETAAEAEAEAEAAPSETVLILSILARDGTSLSGKSINSVAHANNMVFGDMNIYHRMDASNKPVFSLVNMVKPGSFDPATIHDLKTPGVSLFLQLPGPSNAAAAFDEMLQTASRMAEALEARLCDRRRQPLTESEADEYRRIAASFDGEA